MKLKVFSVFDAKVAAFMQPMFAPTTGSAMRSFADAVQDQGSMISKHPADFSFHQVGEWDDSSGVFLEFPSPVMLGQAAEYVAPVADEVPRVVRRSGS